MAGRRVRRGLQVTLLALAAGLLTPPGPVRAEQKPAVAAPAAPSAADAIADVFSQVGDRIYEDCVFELSDEQIEVQRQLIAAYMEKGASGASARRLAAQQIQPPKLSKKCEELKRTPSALSSWTTALATPEAAAPAEKPVVTAPKAPAGSAAAPVSPAGPSVAPTPATVLATKQMLPQWDCAPNVDFVTITLNGYPRKLTGGEICNPYQDVVHEVPATVPSFRLGYTIKTGRLFVVSADDPSVDGHTIAWAISGRDVCRNNPDPDCLAARALGPLPPGEYTFGGDKNNRITWGPKTKRNVVAVYLQKLAHRDRFSKAHIAAMLARGNIAIHARLKGEMSEACLGLEPKGWNYVASLVKDNRANGLTVYIDEPYPQVAEAPPLVEGSSFSLTSLFQ